MEIKESTHYSHITSTRSKNLENQETFKVTYMMIGDGGPSRKAG